MPTTYLIFSLCLSLSLSLSLPLSPSLEKSEGTKILAGNMAEAGMSTETSSTLTSPPCDPRGHPGSIQKEQEQLMQN